MFPCCGRHRSISLLLTANPAEIYRIALAFVQQISYVKRQWLITLVPLRNSTTSERTSRVIPRLDNRGCFSAQYSFRLLECSRQCEHHSRSIPCLMSACWRVTVTFWLRRSKLLQSRCKGIRAICSFPNRPDMNLQQPRY